jgi:hypothetical protein
VLLPPGSKRYDIRHRTVLLSVGDGTWCVGRDPAVRRAPTGPPGYGSGPARSNLMTHQY